MRVFNSKERNKILGYNLSSRYFNGFLEPVITSKELSRIVDWNKTKNCAIHVVEDIS